jgi:hypothetical protein
MSVASLKRDLEIQMGTTGGSLTDQGTYNALTAYVTDDVVVSSAIVYRALKATTGETPASTPASWAPMPGSGATSATITALSSAITAAATTLLSTRQANRVTLLSAAVNALTLGVGNTVQQMALAFVECQAVATFLAAAQTLDSQLAVLRVRDLTGTPLTSVLANIPAAAYATWGSALVTSAASYATLLAEAPLTA